MEIEFWKPQINSQNLKATIHQNGNLGFSSSAMKYLNLTENKFAKIGFNKGDSKDKHLYMVIVEQNCEECLKVNKAGNYYYLNTTIFFNEIRLDYKKKKVMFDIVEIENKGNKFYKLIKREVERKRKSNN